MAAHHDGEPRSADELKSAIEELPSEDPFPVVEQRRVDPEKNLNRNDPCWCGSGKKYKRCHGA